MAVDPTATITVHQRFEFKFMVPVRVSWLQATEALTNVRTEKRRNNLRKTMKRLRESQVKRNGQVAERTATRAAPRLGGPPPGGARVGRLRFPSFCFHLSRFVSSASPNFTGDSHPRGRGPDGPRLTPTLAGPTARGNQGPAARRNRVAAGRAAAAPSVTMAMTERAGVAAKRNSSGRVAGGGYTAAPA